MSKASHGVPPSPPYLPTTFQHPPTHLETDKRGPVQSYHTAPPFSVAGGHTWAQFSPNLPASVKVSQEKIGQSETTYVLTVHLYMQNT